jgi:tetratricopeptide (TPR) repeat protein
MQMQADALRALEQRRKAGLRDSLEKQFLTSMQAGNIGLGAMQLQRMKTEFPDADLSTFQKQLDQQKNQFQKQRDFENLLEIARRNSQDGLIAQSKEALLNALKIQPESPVAKQMLADIQREEARQATVEEQRRKDLQKAEALLAAGQIQSAKKVDLSLSGVGKVDQEVKQVQRNIREAEFARTPEKDRRAQELFLEGIAKYRVGDYEEALEKWKLVLQLNPDHDQAKKYMANVKQKLSRMQ